MSATARKRDIQVYSHDSQVYLLQSLRQQLKLILLISISLLIILQVHRAITEQRSVYLYLSKPIVTIYLP